MPVRQKIVREGDKVYNVWTQPEQREVYRQNEEDRKRNPRKSDWIKPAARMSEVDREVLKRRRPEIFEDRRKFEKYLNTSEGSRFRTTPRGRSRNFSFGGV